MAWKVVRITIETEWVERGRANAGRTQTMVLEGKALETYIGIGWGELKKGPHKGKHIFDKSIFAGPDPIGRQIRVMSAPRLEAFRLKEPDCGVWP